MGKNQNKLSVLKLKVIEHKDNVFNREYLYLVGNISDAKDYVSKKLDQELDVDNDIIGVYERVGRKSIIWLEKFENSPEDYSVLAHECLHATFDLMDYVGIEYESDGNNEAFTHYLGSLIEAFLTKI